LIPNYSTYTLGATYDGSSQVGKNNPLFVSYSLPAPDGMEINYLTGSNFQLQSTSPAIGKGYTGFTPVTSPGGPVTSTGTALTMPVDPTFGATTLLGPGKDIGCYQSTGTGNMH